MKLKEYLLDNLSEYTLNLTQREFDRNDYDAYLHLRMLQNGISQSKDKFKSESDEAANLLAKKIWIDLYLKDYDSGYLYYHDAKDGDMLVSVFMFDYLWKR